jgi:hypothetical protein
MKMQRDACFTSTQKPMNLSGICRRKMEMKIHCQCVFNVTAKQLANSAAIVGLSCQTRTLTTNVRRRAMLVSKFLTTKPRKKHFPLRNPKRNKRRKKPSSQPLLARPLCLNPSNNNPTTSKATQTHRYAHQIYLALNRVKRKEETKNNPSLLDQEME